MTVFDTIPDLPRQLGAVSDRIRSLAEDKLFRQPLTDILSHVFAAPGKQLRPAMLLLFGRIGQDYPACEERLIHAAAVVELTHMASLIHDDIVDDSPLRRGRPTIQSAYGKDMAVYAGDYLLSCVLSAVTAPDMSGVGGILSRAMSDMCSGEMSQYQIRFDTSVDENRYFMNISGKTAALFSAACEIGSSVAGGSLYVNSIAGRFGHSVGILFQLRDDLLDCMPDSSDAGKKHGMDFINGIYTLPVIYSFSDPVHGPALRELAAAASGMAPEAVAAALREHITAAGGVDYTRWIMKQYHERALHTLSQLQGADLKDELSALLDELSAG